MPNRRRGQLDQKFCNGRGWCYVCGRLDFWTPSRGWAVGVCGRHEWWNRPRSARRADRLAYRRIARARRKQKRTPPRKRFGLKPTRRLYA